MADERAGLSREEARQYFEIAVHFLGQSWLNEWEREFYGEENNDHIHQKSPPEIVAQYRRGLEEFGYKEAKVPEILSPEELSEPTLRMTNLGRYISDLTDADSYYSSTGDVEFGLPSSIQNRLRNDNEWEKTVFELQIAAGYAREGYEVQLIEEGDEPEADIRIPLDPETYIECKRADSLPGSAQKRKGISETLFKSTSARMDRTGIAIFELSEVPDHIEASKIGHHLPKLSNSSREHHIELPYGVLHILPFLEPNKIKRISKVGISNALQLTEFVEIEVRPILETKLGISPQELDNATLQSDIRPDNGSFLYRNPLYLGAFTSEVDNYIQPVLNQFQSSLRKFDDSTANILHVDIPNMLDKMQTEDVEEIKRRIGGLLWKNPKMTAFCLSTENFNRNSEGIDFGHVMTHMLNKNRAVDLPPDFDLLGIPIEDFEEMIYNK